MSVGVRVIAAVVTRFVALVSVVSLATEAGAPVIRPLDKTDDCSVVVPAADPCVSYSCFIYQPA